MKKILSSIIIAISLTILSCGQNNDGPFTTLTKENGIMLYSGKKPASGWVKDIGIYGEDSLAVYLIKDGEAKIHYKNGYPSGDFFISYGNLKMESEAKLKDKKNYYSGEIKITKNDGFLKIEGDFIHDFAQIYKTVSKFTGYNWNDTNLFFNNILKLLNTGKIEIQTEDGIELVKAELKNGSGFLNYYQVDGTLMKEIKYLNGIENEMIEYYEDGSKRYESIEKDGERNEISYYHGGVIEREKYYRDNTVELKEYYENGKLKKQEGYLYHSEKGRLPNGVFKEINAEGIVLSLAEYKEGKKNGEFMETSYMGEALKKIVSHYKDDVLNGEYQVYLDDELIESGDYIDGEKDGEWTKNEVENHYFGIKKREEKLNFKEGLKEGEYRVKKIIIYNDSTPEMKDLKEEKEEEYGNYKNDRRNGKREYKREKIGREDEKILEYYHSVERYKEDQKEGIQEFYRYTPSGEVSEIEIYENSKIIESIVIIDNYSANTYQILKYGRTVETGYYIDGEKIRSIDGGRSEYNKGIEFKEIKKINRKNNKY
ncbi:hypothetical protein [Fusobacterium gastrosuis]|uniref:hypothetical protein n=1 Tax=Fusobacterium gastrosuis TaxID=1755100 RepID=UPI002A99F9A2|nr:hypothetical protein [Fusobacterium gastrosuis]